MSKAHTHAHMGARTHKIRASTHSAFMLNITWVRLARNVVVRSLVFLEEQRAAKRAKLEQMQLVVEDSEHKCSRVGALSLISLILLLILFNNFKVQSASAHRCQLVATF